ncbi:methyl-accepting chemotaxis protein [Clostridium estertheticum]|uniref:Methyl-accepting chemotaxis protein n=1 Tax=Clostridium estertheticum TaxID=238834 RepID=A0A7Y3SWG8_9CLOT|nr:methyl-accepting chemotaxis protein [Clostridium estertheticum]NNU76629.1 methyl-accepting chemotaxis protein [Clostridium estertheticum]WBL45370.1 methyl-accepting chemotaxis protein [Clostridium estertheticum]
MISINGLDYLKTIAELQANIIPGGVLFAIIEKDIVTWRKSSEIFDLDFFNVGEVIKSESIANKAMNDKKTITANIPRSIYGTRLKTVATPLMNDTGEVVGVFSMIFPRLHPVASAFSDFAPIVAEMFPEGSTMIITDLQKIVSKQSSKKFDIASLQVDNILLEESLSLKTIKSKKAIINELDASVYGIPTLGSSYPMFDEDNSDEVVGCFAIITPKENASNLRNMSENLENGLTGMASAIEELAASAANIHTNEIELHNEIKDIIILSEEINEVSSFIKEIADETKMLGLNAAIEAARAGDAGRGFGVVAQEIRKLSEQSKSTVPKIKKLTDSIKLKVNEASERSESSLASSQEQAAASEEITASVEELTSMSEELNKIAQDI